MERIPEPDLMDDPAQAEAYHQADFSEPHEQFVALFHERFGAAWKAPVLDLGCGTGDITRRFARAFSGVSIDGVDGAESMLRLGRLAVERAGLAGRVQLTRCYLPTDQLPRLRYGAVISNSLLHHLKEPDTLWSTIVRFAEPGARVFVMDLLRPHTLAQVAALVERYAAGEPAVLRRDFGNSLCAAYRIPEVREQIGRAGLDGLTLEQVSDRHWIAWGRV